MNEYCAECAHCIFSREMSVTGAHQVFFIVLINFTNLYRQPLLLYPVQRRIYDMWQHIIYVYDVISEYILSETFGYIKKKYKNSFMNEKHVANYQ